MTCPWGALPLAVRNTPRFVNWFLTTDGRKVPLCSTGKRRAAFKVGEGPRSNSHATLNEAIRRDVHHVGWDLDTPYFGVDLDHVIGARGKLTVRGRELLKTLPATYTEISHSGTGLHLIYRVLPAVHAQLPNSAKGDHVEIYSRLRWFVLTGGKLGSQQQVQLLTLRAALAVFALGVVQPVQVATAKRYDEPPGLWSAAALEAFLVEAGVEYRAYGGKPDEYRVRCPGTVGWWDGVQHDDDGLRGNATCVTVRNGHACFHCHHAKCAGRTWRDFARHYLPSFDITLHVLSEVQRGA